MSELDIKIYTSSNQLPPGLVEDNIFHSPAFFRLAKRTPRHKPYMVTVETADGTIVAQMLALIRYHSSLFPPYLYRHCRIMGEGVYSPQAPLSTQELFSMMLQKLVSEVGRWTLYTEVSNLSGKMFAYKELRENHFFPVRWVSIHNSLHSHTPEERISERMQKRIDTAYKRGVVTEDVKSDADFQAIDKAIIAATEN